MVYARTARDRSILPTRRTSTIPAPPLVERNPAENLNQDRETEKNSRQNNQQPSIRLDSQPYELNPFLFVKHFSGLWEKPDRPYPSSLSLLKKRGASFMAERKGKFTLPLEVNLAEKNHRLEYGREPARPAPGT
jgi:hypothetical protein